MNLPTLNATFFTPKKFAGRRFFGTMKTIWFPLIRPKMGASFLGGFHVALAMNQGAKRWKPMFRSSDRYQRWRGPRSHRSGSTGYSKGSQRTGQRQNGEGCWQDEPGTKLELLTHTPDGKQICYRYNMK